MKSYSTQLEAAKKGIITPEMKHVAQAEKVDIHWLMTEIACGRVIIPHNINHTALKAKGIGSGLSTKINVNLGISKDACDYHYELSKAQKAIDHGAHAIMDLSNYGKTADFRSALIDTATCMIGTVPIYDAMGFYDKPLGEISSKDLLKVVETHAQNGVDFVTIHAGINQYTARTFNANPRQMNIVSRGGSLLYAWMTLTGQENPFYEHFDALLDILSAYDVTLSLGDAMRPGGIKDATDASQIQELLILGELTKRAWEKNVQVMIEGPGHMRLNEIKTNVQLAKKLCHGAPFYVLGPLVTDVAPGYDHITGAIGGAIAASEGADFLCYVTPAEHLRLPSLDDMIEGIMASKIAAHAGDLVKNVPGALDWDVAMSDARHQLDWESMFNLAIDPEKARDYREHADLEDEKTCSMCGKMCAIRTLNKIQAGENLNHLKDQ